MLAFIYKDEIYIRAIPVKRLFNSNLVHNVITRGDVFAIKASTNELTVIPGTAEVQHINFTEGKYTPIEPKK